MGLGKQLNFSWLYSFHSDHLNFFFLGWSRGLVQCVRGKTFMQLLLAAGGIRAQFLQLKDTVVPAGLKMLWNPHLSSWASLYAPLGLSANTNKGQIPIKNARGHCNVAKEALWVVLLPAWCRLHLGEMNWMEKRSFRCLGFALCRFQLLQARLSSWGLGWQLWPPPLPAALRRVPGLPALPRLCPALGTAWPGAGTTWEQRAPGVPIRASSARDLGLLWRERGFASARQSRALVLCLRQAFPVFEGFEPDAGRSFDWLAHFCNTWVLAGFHCIAAIRGRNQNWSIINI